MATSSSKVKSSTRKVPNGWYKPFVAFLEPLQVEWDMAADEEAKQAFLRETRDALKDWADAQSVSSQLPEASAIKVVRL